MEVAELGSYLFVACVFATLLQHPASVVRESVSSGLGSGPHGRPWVPRLYRDHPWKSRGHHNPQSPSLLSPGKGSFGMEST
jgi:hypothetical protein